MTVRRIGLASWTVALLIGVVPATAVVAAPGRCESAAMAESFVLPDGSEHVGGKLMVCDRSYSPDRPFLETYVDGVATGRFVASARAIETTDGRDLVIFRRRNGRLHLIGLTVPGGRAIDFYSVEPISAGSGAAREG